MGKELIFYYDIICPYAYLVSKSIGEVARRNGAILHWRPVLLGGIYKKTKKENANIPDNKMLLTYSDQKRKIMSQDLSVQLSRHGITSNRFSIPDVRTINSLRLIASTESETAPLRSQLTHLLYNALWKEEKDVSRYDVLQDVADSAGYEIDVRSLLKDKSHPSKEYLLKNRDEVVERGAFGVPSFWVNNRLYFGGDRLFLVERELGNMEAHPHRLLSTSTTGAKEKPKLTVYFDFSSPWSFMGLKQLPALLSTLSDVSVEIEWVPIYLGALFQAIGTPGVPMLSMGENKRNYQSQDFNDWLKYHNINNFQFSSHFPIKTTLPLRIALMKKDYKIIDLFYDAAWCKNLNIGEEKVVADVLEGAGYPSKELIDLAKTDDLKNQLKMNNDRALAEGVCGVPSFQVNDGPVIFGQDRLNVVADSLLGWESPFPRQESKL